MMQNGRFLSTTIRGYTTAGGGYCRRLYRKAPQVFRYAQANASEEGEILGGGDFGETLAKTMGRSTGRLVGKKRRQRLYRKWDMDNHRVIVQRFFPATMRISGFGRITWGLP